MTGSRIRTHMGQGKLYIQIENFDSYHVETNGSDDDDDLDELPSVPSCSSSSAKEDATSSGDTTGDDTHTPAGTPTVLIRRQQPTATCTTGASEALGDDELPDLNSCRYQTYVDIGEDFLEEEDMDLKRAIEASLAEQPPTLQHQSSESFASLLMRLQSEFQSEKGGQSMVLVNRKNIFSSTMRAIKHPKFSFMLQPKVQFVGEEADDFGGPTKEYFRLLMRDVMRKIFLGSDENKVFSYDLHHVETEVYHTCGMLVAWSVLFDGPGLHCINPNVVSLMMGKQVRDMNYLDIPDEDVTSKIKRIIDAHDQKEYSKTVADLTPWLIDCGCTQYTRSSIETKQQCVDTLCRYFLYFRVKVAADQFTKGMDALGKLWTNLIMVNKEAKSLLAYTDGNVTREVFQRLCDIERAPEGSNQYTAEHDTLYCWEVYLHECEGVRDVNLNRILEFITGADRVPPLGFTKPITISFFSMSEDEKKKKVTRYPFASTCGLQLSLPRGISEPDEFKSLMDRAVLDCCGFGKV